MKFQPNPRQGQSLVRLAAMSLLAAIVSSCSTGAGQVDRSKHTVPAVSDAWVKVRSTPPTWYPRGVAADHPTDHRSGTWILAEDSLDTRFFIPNQGLPPDLRKSLEAEALAAIHPKRKRQVAIEDAKQTTGKIVLLVLGGLARAPVSWESLE